MSPTVKPLSIPFNVAVLHITQQCLPLGFDVSAIAPQCYDSLVAHYRETGRILVWNGASHATIFGDCEVNFAFRAWHDSKHVLGQFPFTREGEISAMIAQRKDICALYDGAQADYFSSILEAEIYGQFIYSEQRGGFPIDQIGFARAYLKGPSSAIAGDFGVSMEA